MSDWSAPTWPLPSGWHGEATVGMDVAGVVHVAWTESGDGGQDELPTGIAYATRTQGGWSVPERVPCGSAAIACSDAALAVDALGIVHLVYVALTPDGAEIDHRERTTGAARWSAAERVSAGGDGARRLDPVVLADRLDVLHVAWSDGTGGGDVLYRQRLPDGEWRAVTTVHDPGNGAQSAPALALAANGTVHAVWRDDRDGQLAVWTSQLPERSHVWWPDAALSRSADGIAGEPAIAATSDGVVRAAWVATDRDDLTRIHVAQLSPTGPYWAASHPVAVGERGAVLDVAIAAAPNADAAIAWTEARPAGRSRLYFGRLDMSGTLVDRKRVDGTVREPSAREPVIAADGVGQAVLVWDQPAVAGGGAATAFSLGRLPEPQRNWQSFEGFLDPEPIVFGCQRDGYRLIRCDGTTATVVLSDLPDLARLAGAYVTLEGWVIDEMGCPRVTAESFGLRTPPCERTSATAFGSLVQDGRPRFGARVFFGSSVVQSGGSGRFALTGLQPGTAGVTVTAPCALSLSAGTIALQPRQRLDLGQAALIAGDVVPDCVIDVRDLARAAWDVRQPADDTSACSDVNRDGAVNVGDLDLIRQRMGLRCPQPWSPTPVPLPASILGRADGS